MALNRGDIAFVQYNADGTDNFAFVTLVNIPAGEIILFTDNGWLNTNAFRTGEGIITWTAPAGGVTAGTVITVSTTPSASLGSVTESGDLNFSADGDQIIAYQTIGGVVTPIAALNNEGAAIFQPDATSSNTSALPQGLNLGANAVAVNEIDNAVYTGPTTGDLTTLQAALNNPSNWTGNDTVNQTFTGTFTVNGGGGGGLPTVTIAASPDSTTEGSATAALFTITRTGDTSNALTVNFTTGGTATSGIDYLTPASFATNSIEIPAGQNSVSIAISAIDDTDIEVVENVAVTLSASPNYTLGATNTATITINDNDTPISPTLISQIQGSGTAATAGTFTIEGIVIGDFQGTGQLGGFYLQEEDADADGSALTSEGIFVNSLFAVNVGDRVRLTGTVQENSSTPSFGQAVITPGTTGGIQVTGTGLQSLVTATTVDLPTVALGDLERYEGMLVTFPETLTVTETFNLGRFGEVVLSANGRLFNPTNFIDPNDNPASGTTSSGSSNVAAVTAQQNLNDRSRIILDDGSGLSNLSDVPYIDTTDANPLNDTLRIGSTLTGLTGVLGFGFSNYRIQPTQTPNFDYAPRPDVPTVGGNLKVASFNVLNYFNGDGLGGGFPTSRGADSLAEFNRQRAKIIAAIDQLDADVVGLIELENDGDGTNSAIADLVNGLNAIAGAGTYDFIRLANTTGTPGTDEIKVAFIYKPSAVTPVGNAIYFNDPAFDTARPPLAQTFRLNATGETFTPIINHFKSKSSAANLPGDADQGDGQGLSNATRVAQANALLSFVSQIQTASGDGDVMVIGDLNAYNEEDPIDVLRAGGLTKLVTPTESFVFQGQTGSLDHALVTPSLLAQVTGAAKWNINADEPITLDYNDDILTSGEGTAEDRNDTTLYAPTPFRSSDHDPVLVGLSLIPTLTIAASGNPAEAGNIPGTFSISRGAATSGNLTVNLGFGGTADATDYTVSANVVNNTVVIPDGQSSVTVTVTPVDDADAEPAETIALTLTPGSNYRLGNTPTATLTIVDTDVNLINGTNRSDTITGTAANDGIRGGDGDDTISSLDGNDIVEGGRGGDILRGGAGNDVLAADRIDRFDDALGTVSELYGEAGNDTLYGGNKADLLDGGTEDDILFGKGNNDQIFGGDGNDLLNGGVGNDLLNGGAGVDTADYSDLVFNGVFGSVAGLDVNLTTGIARHSSTNNALTWTDTLTGIENVTGTSRNDRFIGDASDNIFAGRGEVGRNDRRTSFTDLDGDVYTVIADVVEYSGNRADFSIFSGGSADNFRITGTGIGTDTLIGIEFVKFNDGLFASSTLLPPV
jgi:predicted extracellular nuclease